MGGQGSDFICVIRQGNDQGILYTQLRDDRIVAHPE